MSKLKKVEQAKTKKAQVEAAERIRMEQFVIYDYTPLHSYNELEKYEAWVAKVKAMTTAELVKEFNKRDGDHVLKFGCKPEDMEAESLP